MNRMTISDIIQKYAMVAVLVFVVIVFSAATHGSLLLPNNVSNLVGQNAYVFVLATGMLLCILTGGNIDLSVGSIVCFVGAIGALIMVKINLPAPVAIPLAIVAMLIIGTIAGAWQAFWISYVRIPPFIVTLAGMLAFRGLSNAILNGQSISLQNYPVFLKLFGGGSDCYIPDFLVGGKSPVIAQKIVESGGATSTIPVTLNVTCFVAGFLGLAAYLALEIIGRQRKQKKGYEVENIISWLLTTVLIAVVIGFVTIKLSLYRGIPNALVIVLIVVAIYSYITNNTTVGRHFYAVGGNEKATKLSGINTNKIYFLAYTNMGLLSAVAAMLVMARSSSAQTTAGNQFEMDAIASCFIGGASAYGGIGTVPGAIIGALLMGVINIGMFSLGVNADWQKVVKGSVLLLAVIFDVVSKRGFRFFAKD